MAKDEVYVGDKGIVYNVTIMRSDTNAALDISTANTSTARLAYFKKGNGSVETVTAAFVGSGSDGAMTITTPVGLFDVDGEYRLQIYLSLNSGAQILSSDQYVFRVKNRIYA